jgi:hypothetical protein
MHRLMASCPQPGNPFDREVHVDQQPGHQLRTSASSRSSMRQAA